MLIDYKKEAVKQLAVKIMAAGFRVFIAARGTHGFYTDNAGSRVVSFQYDLGGIKFTGNYKTNQPRSTGTGWGLEHDNFLEMFNQAAPNWALRGATWTYTTLAQHLAAYQSSSLYVEQQRGAE
jgi:hypothetical protein